jgi:serine/threonine protein kinase/WD40 repeat protein
MMPMMPNDEGVGADGRGAAMRALFDAAIGHGPEDRTAFLRETARRRGVDDELIDEVVGLLAFVDATRIDENAVSDADAPDRLVGCRLGAFTLDRLVGIGGTAAVFEATQDRPRRTVAVKVLRQGIAGPRARRRFEREIEIAGRLEHPAIARVLDSGTMRVDGFDTPWLAMEFVPDARTITRYAREANLDLRERVALVRAALAGVAAAHRRGIIHRDLKPANILVDGKGRIRVIDFGIARQSGGPIGAMTATVPGQVIGTVPFMAPEQLDGDSDAVDVRTDVYAIGVTLHLLLTGRMPYETSDCSFIEAARRIREVEIGSLRRLDGTIDRDLDGIVQKALAKSADARYPSIEALDADLEAWLEHRPVTARPLGRLARWGRLIQRHSLSAAMIATATMLLMGTVVVLGVMLDRESDLRMAAGRSTAKAAFAAAAAALREGDATGAMNHLSVVPPNERDWGYRWLLSQCVQSDFRLELPDADVPSIDILPATEDRPQLLLITSYRGTWAFELDSRQLRWQLPENVLAGYWKHVVVPDPDRVVVCGLKSDLLVLDLETGDILDRIPTPGAMGTMATIDRSTVLLGGDDGVLHRLDLDDRRIVTSRQLNRDAIQSMIVLPDGRILVGTKTGALIETDEMFEEIRQVSVNGRMIARIRMDAAGRRVAICNGDGTVHLLDASDLSRIAVLGGHLAEVWDARFDEEHDRLVTVSLDESVRVFDLQTHKMIRRVSGAHQFIWSLAIEADGAFGWIGTHDGSVHRVALTLDDVQVPEGERAIGIAWSPDGTRIVVRTDSSVHELDRETGDWRTALELPWNGPCLPGSSASIVWNKDGIWTDGGESGGLWLVEPGLTCGRHVLAGESITAAASSPEGGVIVVTEKGMVVAVSSSGVVERRKELPVRPSAIIVDRGHRQVHVISRRSGEATVLDLDTFEIVGDKRGYGRGPTFTAAMSNDGDWLAAGCRERPRGLTSMPNPLTSMEDRIEKSGHSGDVRFVGFVDEGQRLISGGDDGRVLLHRRDGTTPLMPVIQFATAVEGLAISPDGQAIAATDGAVVRILDPERISP